MRGFLFIILVVVVAVGGWLAGSMFPAPTAWTGMIVSGAGSAREKFNLPDISLDELRAALSPEQYDELRTRAAAIASQSGDAILVERGDGPLEEHVDRLEAEAQAAAAEGSSAFETALALCPRMTVSNAPATTGEDRQVADYHPFVLVNNTVVLAANPTRGACLSSAFGPRGSTMHKGVDYHNSEGGPILAAGDGVVVEKKYRDDYGNMLLIDHGAGVYTRYAHLATFQPGLSVGSTVKAGQQIGLMGNTASYRIPIHLHFEILTGDYASAKASFGLDPQSPFALPAAG